MKSDVRVGARVRFTIGKILRTELEGQVLAVGPNWLAVETPGNRRHVVAREEVTRVPARSFPVTDPDLDAPDGAIVDGYRRVGMRWEPLRDNQTFACAGTDVPCTETVGIQGARCATCIDRLLKIDGPLG